jgi:hypothetical protein
VNVPTMPIPKSIAPRTPDAARRAGLEKYAIVTGTIGNTHGVSRERRPVLMASQRNAELMPCRYANGGAGVSVRGCRQTLSLQTW